MHRMPFNVGRLERPFMKFENWDDAEFFCGSIKKGPLSEVAGCQPQRDMSPRQRFTWVASRSDNELRSKSIAEQKKVAVGKISKIISEYTKKLCRCTSYI